MRNFCLNKDSTYYRGLAPQQYERPFGCGGSTPLFGPPPTQQIHISPAQFDRRGPSRIAPSRQPNTSTTSNPPPPALSSPSAPESSANTACCSAIATNNSAGSDRRSNSAPPCLR